MVLLSLVISILSFIHDNCAWSFSCYHFILATSFTKFSIFWIAQNLYTLLPWNFFPLPLLNLEQLNPRPAVPLHNGHLLYFVLFNKIHAIFCYPFKFKSLSYSVFNPEFCLPVLNQIRNNNYQTTMLKVVGVPCHPYCYIVTSTWWQYLWWQ